jgi:predicted exporter
MVILSLVFIWKKDNVWQNDLNVLSPVNEQAQKQDFEFRKSLNLPELRFLLFIEAVTAQQALEQSELLTEKLDSLVKQNVISAYDMAARYLPSRRKQLLNQQILPHKQQLENDLHKTVGLLNLNYNIFTPFINTVEYNKNAMPLSYNDLEDPLVLSKIKPLLYQTPAVNKHNTKWIALIPLMGVNPDLLSQVNFSNLAMDVKLIDIKKNSNTILENYTHEAVKWFFGGSFFIIVFIIFYTRQIKNIHQLLIPFSAAVIMTITTLLLAGYSLTIFHVVTLLLVVGLGIDYSLFIQNNISVDFLSDAQHEERRKIITISIFSVLVCTISTFIMFSSLAFSNIPVLRAIGLTAATGSLLAFIMSLILSRPCK